MPAKHVGILRGHMFDELFLIVEIDHILSDMRCVARCREQHHELQLRRVDLAVALIGKRNELVGNADKDSPSSRPGTFVSGSNFSGR